MGNNIHERISKPKNTKEFVLKNPKAHLKTQKYNNYNNH